MEQIKENIACLQKNLHQSLERKTNEQKIYLLSVKLDREIVRYYRSLTKH